MTNSFCSRPLGLAIVEQIRFARMPRYSERHFACGGTKSRGAPAIPMALLLGPLALSRSSLHALPMVCKKHFEACVSSEQFAESSTLLAGR